MAGLKEKVQIALDESRILVLGTQVLVGFGFRSTLEPRFDQLTKFAQVTRLVSIALLLVTFVLLIAPCPYHQIRERGHDSARLNRFTVIMVAIALAPFAVAMGIDFAVAYSMVLGHLAGAIAGAAAALTAIFFWYVVELLSHRHAGDEMKDEGPTPLHSRIQHVLTEARVILPGAQALLGFQFASILVSGFTELPRSSQIVHLASLALVALATILLIAPAAYHRIVEKGEDTEHFHRTASALVLSALPPLALGVTGDFYVVARKIIGSQAGAIVAAGALFAFAAIMWFALSFIRAARERPAARPLRPREA